MRIRDLNWMQVEEYLRGDDRIVLPVGSTEQHAYLSLETDNILAERASVEAAEPLGVPVLPAIAYGVTGFTAYPGSPSLQESTLIAVVSDVVDSLLAQGIRAGPRRQRSRGEHEARPDAGERARTVQAR